MPSRAALGFNPPLLLADEPTAHLDYIQVEGVLKLLRELANGDRLVVVATHDNRMLAIADRVVELVPSVDSRRARARTGRARGGRSAVPPGLVGRADLRHRVGRDRDRRRARRRSRGDPHRARPRCVLRRSRADLRLAALCDRAGVADRVSSWATRRAHSASASVRCRSNGSRWMPMSWPARRSRRVRRADPSGALGRLRRRFEQLGLPVDDPRDAEQRHRRDHRRDGSRDKEREATRAVVLRRRREQDARAEVDRAAGLDPDDDGTDEPDDQEMRSTASAAPKPASACDPRCSFAGASGGNGCARRTR